MLRALPPLGNDNRSSQHFLRIAFCANLLLRSDSSCLCQQMKAISRRLPQQSDAPGFRIIQKGGKAAEAKERRNSVDFIIVLTSCQQERAWILSTGVKKWERLPHMAVPKHQQGAAHAIILQLIATHSEPVMAGSDT